MKTAVLAVTILSLGAASLTSVQAGDREWATAGKVLTGVVAAGVIVNALQPQYERTVVYQTPPPQVIYVPAPVCQPYRPMPATVVYCSAPAPRVVYVPAPHFHQPYRLHGHFGGGR
ncbi:MAG TPA: hypothetical protein VMB21_16200 [Candidatus Limnocylindria bacterium]|jgi:hypothetical protein|nr:hypothetical protein [Candidatus Limnocylindria bacterium]